MSRNKGFTLIELLVVIAIIAILMAFSCRLRTGRGGPPDHVHQQSQTDRRQFAHVRRRQQRQAAAQRNDRLALGHLIQHDRLHHVDRWQPGDVLLPRRSHQEARHGLLLAIHTECQSAAHIGDIEEPTADRQNYYRVTGYFWMLDTKSGHQRSPIWGRRPKQWVKTLNCKRPGETEMIVDATLSTTDDPDTGNFAEVRGGSFTRADPRPHESPRQRRPPGRLQRLLRRRPPQLAEL